MQGKSYEQLLGRADRKRLGVYYTPDTVIDFILANTVASADLTVEAFPRILDPACGCGYFLLKAYDLLYHKFSDQLSVLRKKYSTAEYYIHKGSCSQKILGNRYWQPEFLPYHIVTHCLFGADIDEAAVDLTRQSLQKKAGLSSLEPNVLVCDSLTKWEQIRKPPATTDTDNMSWSKKFDYVIGNPPYISYGLRGVSLLDKQRYKQLLDEFPNSAEYKISIYALFFERGIELLKPQGKLAYITPDSFLSGKYFSKLRKLLAACSIESITLLEFPVFREAAIGKGVITVLKKGEPQGNYICVQAAEKAEEMQSGKFTQQYKYKQHHLGSRFSLFFNQEEFELYYAMQEFQQQLAEFCGVYSGCIARYGQKSIIANKPVESLAVYDNAENLVFCDYQAGGRWRKLIGQGAYITPYCIKPAEQYIYIHEEDAVRRKYGKSGFDLNKYQGEKLFLRQTGAKLIAAYDNQGYFCLNNIHVIYSIDQRISLKVIMALLNSRLYNYYYGCITRECRRVLPQVDIDQVKRLPIISVANQGAIIALVNELIEAYKTEPEEQSRVSVRSDMQEQLERLLLDNLDIRKELKNKILS